MRRAGRGRVLAGTAAQAAFPDRPITLIVPWAAGGGTDAVARQIAMMLERDLKQPINVVNRIGGSGVVGHTAIASARPTATRSDDHARDQHDALGGLPRSPPTVHAVRADEHRSAAIHVRADRRSRP